jgi:serine/threonine-protein kinase
MGLVVAARHIELRRPVALKFMLSHADGGDELIGRFLREARAAARLTSEHSVRVLDVARTKGGTPYLVMELLVGKDLGALIEERGPLPIPEAVDYVLQACLGIAEAHALGIVHRDLKPRNLFVTRRVDGTPLVKVLDFGIAKAVHEMSATSITETDGVIGSPHYMSPEQMRASKDVDARTDVWSLGVTLYELVARTLPFCGDTAMEICAHVLTNPPRPLRAARPDVPPELDALVARCFDKDRGARFADVAALAHALEPFGSAASAGVAARVAAVLVERPVLEDMATTAPIHATGAGSTDVGTMSPWGSPERSERGATRALVGGVALGVALLAAQSSFVYAWHRRESTSRASAAASASATADAVASSNAASIPAAAGASSSDPAGGPTPFPATAVTPGTAGAAAGSDQAAALAAPRASAHVRGVGRHASGSQGTKPDAGNISAKF